MKKNINKDEITSPCISICKTDPRTRYCYGCARTDEEKIIWKKKNTEIIWKKNNLVLLVQRMSGWQLETFKESYSNKIKTGQSLYRQNLKENND